MFKFLKSLFEDTGSVKNSTSKISKNIDAEVKERINSENRIKYGSSYDYIYNYNNTMASWLAMKSVPKYAMDWLAESIKKGVEVEYQAVSFSLEKGMPYLCDTEDETFVFDKEENPMNDSIEGIYGALLHYKYGTTSNVNKYNYWLNHILTLADNGNIIARGFICWRGGYIMDDGKYDGVIPQNIWEESKIKFEDSIASALNEGDPYAKLSVAMYKKDISEEEKEKLYLSAIESGLTDACYYYAKFLNYKRFVADGYTVHMPDYGTDEWQAYMKDELSLYKKGAELNNGILAGYCQYRLGDMYANGDGGVLKDAATAQIWFKKAVENGYEKAKIYIDA